MKLSVVECKRIEEGGYRRGFTGSITNVLVPSAEYRSGIVNLKHAKSASWSLLRQRHLGYQDS